MYAVWVEGVSGGIFSTAQGTPLVLRNSVDRVAWDSSSVVSGLWLRATMLSHAVGVDPTFGRVDNSRLEQLLQCLEQNMEDYVLRMSRSPLSGNTSGRESAVPKSWLPPLSPPKWGKTQFLHYLAYASD